MRLFSYDDIVVHDEDAVTLCGHGWLTDNIICIIYATQCELIKYVNDDDLLKNIGVNSDKWNLFIYNDSNNPDQVYSGTHWSLILFDPNQRKFLLFDPTRNSHETYINEGVSKFVSKLTSYLNITSNKPIYNYCQVPFMEISGDCGIYIIEYARIIFMKILDDFHFDPYLSLKFDGYLKEGLVGVEKAREEWKNIIFALSMKGTKNY